MARKPKNQELPGTEAEKIPELSKAMEEYEEKKVERQEALRTEVKLKDKVIDLMRSNGLVSYRDDDLVVTFSTESKDKIKVTRITSDDD